MDRVIIKNGDIWLINFEPSRRGEFGKKARPSVVIQSNIANEILDTVTLIPITSDMEQSDEMYILLKPSKLNGLNKPSVVVCSHIYTTIRERLIKKIGKVNEQELNGVINAVILHLGIAWHNK